MNFTNCVAYCKIEFAGIGEVDFRKDLNLPIVFCPVLDETLDTAVIVLTDLRKADYRVDVSKAFEPDSVVRIGFEDQETEIRMIIAHDDTKMKRKDDSPFRSWTHSIQLVEETKRLERESVDTLTFTNPIKRHYDAQADAEWEYSGSWQDTFGAWHDSTRIKGHYSPPTIKMLQTGDLVLSTNETTLYKLSGYNYTYIAIYLINVQNNKKITLLPIRTADYKKNTDILIPLKEYGEGEYIVDIFVEELTSNATTGDSTVYIGDFYARFAYSKSGGFLAFYTIADAINRILDLTPLKKKSEANRYKFDEQQLAAFAKEESPEFAFTGHTLFEAMNIIAGYKGSFPVLRENIISFRTLWNGITLTEDDLPPADEEISSSDINQYCTYIETEVQNLVGINNSHEGTVIEPYASGYKTTRSSGGSEISEDTAIISTDYNLYQHIALDMGYTNGTEVGSITPYVYEEAEYNGLSDTSGAYPNSKGYAIKWAQMGRNYTELAHRINKGSSLSNALERPAIANICYSLKGEEVGDNLRTYLNNLINIKKNDSFADLMFRSKYIPIFNARIKQYKEHFGNFHHDGSIKYNQSAELVDSEMYGEHLKGLIRKIGNPTMQKVYVFNSIDEVPAVGTVVDGYSVYAIKMSIRENKVIATISYVKYAELSQYIGVKNPWKDSDISIDKCYNRAVSYNEFLLFTHYPVKYGTGSHVTSKIISNEALPKLMEFTSAAPLTCVQATSYKDDNPIATVLLPVIPLAVGNSLFFQWGYQDNYAAGYTSEPAKSGATNALSGTKYNRAQKAVRYTDAYGRLDTISFYLMPDGPSSTDQSTMRAIAHSLPLFPEIENWSWSGQHYISVEDLLIEKNSSEALTISTQFHYCTDDENFIIGSGLTNFCSLIGGAAKSIGLYGFNERINIFRRRFSVANATKLPNLTFTPNAEKRMIEISLPVEINNFNAWALMGEDEKGNHQIIFGENRKFNGSAFKTNLYLLPMHKLEDFV